MRKKFERNKKCQREGQYKFHNREVNRLSNIRKLFLKTIGLTVDFRLMGLDCVDLVQPRKTTSPLQPL